MARDNYEMGYHGCRGDVEPRRIARAVNGRDFDILIFKDNVSIIKVSERNLDEIRCSETYSAWIMPGI